MTREIPPFHRNNSPYLFDDGTGIGPSMVELEARVRSHALRLKRLEIRRLLWIADNGPAWPILELAAMRAGIVLTPLGPDPSWELVRHVTSITGCDVVLTDDPAALEDHLGHGEPVPPTLGARGWRITPEGRVPPIPAETARISITGGNTGDPRGVCHDGATIWGESERLCATLSMTPHDVHLALLPLADPGVARWVIHSALLSGATTVLSPLRSLGLVGDEAGDPIAIAAMIERTAPTILLVTPAILEGWLSTLPGSDPHVRERLRRVITVGAPLPRAVSRHADELGVPVYSGYGLTEAGGIVSMNSPRESLRGTVGRPHAGMTLRVLADGELMVRGASHLGVLDESGFVPAQEECATGDLASIDGNGFLSIQGRKKNRIVTPGGREICPEWIEEILRAQPSIAEAFVFGEDRPYLAAVILPVRGRESQVHGELRGANLRFPEISRLGGWHIYDRPLSHEERTLTPTGRPNRTEIFARCHHLLYDETRT